MKLIFLFIPFVLYFGIGSQLSGTKWDLYSIQNDKVNFKYVLFKVHSTLEFGDSICSGNAGCNGYGGYYKIEKEMILFGDMATTNAGCGGNSEIVESFLHKNLRKLFYKVDSDTLVLSNQDGIVLKYTKK